MTVVRNSQTVVEVVESGTPNVRNSQTVVEIVESGTPAVRASQVVIEVIQQNITFVPVPIWALTQNLRGVTHV